MSKSNENTTSTKALVLFTVITFVVSWSIWFSIVTLSLPSHEGAGFVLDLIAKFGPTISAVIVTGLLGGRNELKKLLGTLIRLRVKAKCYLIAVAAPFALMFVAIVLNQIIFGIKGPEPQMFAALLNLPVVYGFVLLVNGPLQEELGWRGYALPQLQKRYNNLKSSLALGTIWGLWHIPLFFMEGTAQKDLIYPQNLIVAIIAFMVYTVAISFVNTWIFNKTGRSVFIVILFHAAANSALGVPSVLLELPVSSEFFLIFGVLIGLWALAVIPILRLSKNRTSKTKD